MLKRYDAFETIDPNIKDKSLFSLNLILKEFVYFFFR